MIGIAIKHDIRPLSTLSEKFLEKTNSTHIARIAINNDIAAKIASILFPFFIITSTKKINITNYN